MLWGRGVWGPLLASPLTPKAREIKHRIDLLNPDAPIKHHVQYRMSQSELDEVRK